MAWETKKFIIVLTNLPATTQPALPPPHTMMSNSSGSPGADAIIVLCYKLMAAGCQFGGLVIVCTV